MIEGPEAASRDLLDDTYDGVDRIVLNAADPLCASPGGFHTWWRRRRGGADADRDTAQFMRQAGRFSRRVRASAQAHGRPVIDCAPGERQHERADAHLRAHPEARGLCLILVARAVAPVWEVERSASGTRRNLAKKSASVNHSSFHSVDPEWGPLTIKRAGPPPFGAPVIVNGHAEGAAQGAKQGVVFAKEGTCFPQGERAAELARGADTLAEPQIGGRLSQLGDRWISTPGLCFGLDLAEQERAGFRYAASVYQVEHSRNLLCKRGGQREQVCQALGDRNRARLDLRQLRTIFGTEHRHVRARPDQEAPRVAVALERPVSSLTVCKLPCGRLTRKGYPTGARVLRFAALAHNPKDLGCGRVLAKFPAIVARLTGVLDRALDTFAWLDRAFISDDLLERWPVPSRVGTTRVGGVASGAPRMRLVLAAVLALALAPHGFTAGELAHQVQELGGHTMHEYEARRAAYDVTKRRGKNLGAPVEQSRRYQVLADGLRRITALVVLRERVRTPLRATVAHPLGSDPTRPKQGRKPKDGRALDDQYQTLRLTMHALLNDLHVAHP